VTGHPGEATAKAAALYPRRIEAARQQAGEGAKVIGFVGADVPRELIVAAGAVPVRLHSRAGYSSKEALDLLGGAIDPVAHSILGQVLSGELDSLTGIVFSRDSSASLQQFYVLRQLAERRPSMPPVHLVDILHLPRESTFAYDRAEVARLAAVLVRWTGHAINADSLRAAMRDYEGLRADLAEAQGLRRAGRISGSSGLNLFAAAESLHPANASALVKRVVREASQTPRAGGPRIFYSGSSQDNGSLYAALESFGAHVVGEDHDWGELLLTVEPGPITESGMEELCDQLARAYHRNGPAAPTSAMKDRARWTAGQASRCESDVVLCYTRAFDDAPAWDYPLQRQLLDEAGIPSVLLDRQPPDASPDELRRALSPFLELTTAGTP
jgi:benzoyl-CoA reductase/2-hydroxyglutaryl-CoA dehydratase subunit BcrC/BadD/HgdB